MSDLNKFEIFDGSGDGGWVKLPDSKGAVAEQAQESPHLSCSVVVVNGEVPLPRLLAANSTAIALLIESPLVFAGVESVCSDDIRFMCPFLAC
jgi:hypothetical protein